jgi:hypothetical protein
MAGVRWLTPPKDMAALVTENGRTAFRAELYHFGKTPRELAAQLRMLQKGDYEVSLRTAGPDAKELSRSSLHVGDGDVEIPITLPPATLCELSVSPRK